MSAKRDRVTMVLRIRRVQEMQAAGALAEAGAVVREREQQLDADRRRYEGSRETDRLDGLVPDRLRDRETRALHARAIQRGRARVRQAVESMERRRGDLLEATAAVRAMEKLDERLAGQDEIERRRAELREQDERALTVNMTTAEGAWT